ncbi:TIR domain-containing protein [Lacibacter sp.]|uniref:TIR domain-containing protein n=1 Tax=Lacibacter sp. TaxID=1915409 RepID=UPI002B4B3CED|nr:TIR domain-containing protein [Lacibacter sp.]HLP38082.1 TIR domain-containing protein [Lacibacter sp.]
MGRKVFVSYKYKDEKVAKINDTYYEEVNGRMINNLRNTRVRDYVDKLQEKIGAGNINLGERDGESLENFSDEKIETLLKQRIRQCSVTIVMISKGMKEVVKSEKEQWIPWEVSYSLRTVPTGGYTKQMNAVLGIVLPDENGTYEWYYTSNPNCNSITHHKGQLFKILRDNMFNILKKEIRECNGSQIHENDEPSLIKTVKWGDFMNGNNHEFYIEKSIEIKDDEKSYDVHVNLD